MKCPKCHYVSFEPEPRCRHCGYGFSLADADQALAAGPDATPAAAAEPVEAGARALAAVGAPVPARPGGRPPGLQPVSPASRPAAASPGPERRPFAAASAAGWEPELVRSTPATTELPLFVRPDAAVGADAGPFAVVDEPLVRVPVEPRAPLAVRRPAPDTAPPRPAAAARPVSRRLGPLDRDLLEDLERIERAEEADRVAAVQSARPGPESVGGASRLAAAALDAVIIGGVSAAVLWVTLRWCDLPLNQVSVLPALPMLAFHALVGLGYLLMFTAAGGQTIGKMAFGLRVVGEAATAPSDHALTVSQAAYRVLLSLPSVLALGLGLLPAVLGREEAVHDRLAHTRVVRA